MRWLTKNRVEHLLLAAVVGALLCWAWSLPMAISSPLPASRDWDFSLPVMLLLTVIGCLLASLLWHPPKRVEQRTRRAPLHDL